MNARPIVGFVGLGDQGEPMAERILAAGFDLHVFARRAVQSDPLVAAGAVAASSIAELGERVDLLAVCVGNDADVDEVCDIAVASMAPGSSIAIHSTVHPDTCRAVAARSSELGVSVVDAPVTGGRAGARDGTLTVLIGGEAADVERWQPLFEAYSRLVVHAGPLGAGQIVKLANNSLFAAQLAVTADACELFERLGLDVRQAARAVAASTGGSRCMQMYVDLASTHVFPRHSDGRRRGAELLAKDVGIASSMFRAQGAEVPGDLRRLIERGLAVAVESGQLDD